MSLLIKPMLWRLAVMLLPVLLALSIYSWIDHRWYFNRVMANESHRIETLQSNLNIKLDQLWSEFELLQQSNEVLDFTAQTDDHISAALQHQFEAFSRAFKHFDQVRLLSHNGLELLRINYANGQTQVVEAQQLQDKSQRPYFTEAVAPQAPVVYVSPLDLNIENQQIERPLKPMLRLSVALYNHQKQLRGVLVLNYLAQDFLNLLKLQNPQSQAAIQLINIKGYWLFGAGTLRDWAFMFNRDERFSLQKPAIWQQIKEIQNGQIEHDSELYSFATIRFPQTQEQSTFSRQWLLLSSFPKPTTVIEPKQRLQLLLALSPLLLGSLILIAYLWTRANLASIRHQQRIQLLSKSVEESHELIYITDHLGRIEYANPAFERTTGYSLAEIMGKTPAFLNSGHHDQAFFADLWRTILAGKTFEALFVNRKKNGQEFFEQKIISPICSKTGAIESFVSNGRDMSEIEKAKKLRDNFYQLAYFDQLTGLPNRHFLEERLLQAMATTERLEKLLAVMFLDLDGFKQVNDQYGHEQGDVLLHQVAQRLKANFRVADTVVRLGGDEFVILLEFINEIRDAEIVVKHLVERLAEPYDLSGSTVQVSASIGVSIFPFDQSNPATLLHQADQAMYQAKLQGKNQFAFYRKDSSPIPDHLEDQKLHD